MAEDYLERGKLIQSPTVDEAHDTECRFETEPEGRTGKGKSVTRHLRDKGDSRVYIDGDIKRLCYCE